MKTASGFLFRSVVLTLLLVIAGAAFVVLMRYRAQLWVSQGTEISLLNRQLYIWSRLLAKYWPIWIVFAGGISFLLVGLLMQLRRLKPTKLTALDRP